MTAWSTAAPAIGAAFAASLVEVVEAFSIVLAVAVTRGWRTAAAGTGAALLALAVIVAGLGPALAHVPLTPLRFAVGALLLLFGLGWLHKAVLRSAGLLRLHDEDAAFAKQAARLGGAADRRIDAAGVATAFQGVLLEGIEVVFVVVAVGAGRGLMGPAALGAAAACGLVLAVGAAVHRPLSRVPENTLKLLIGVMLSSFGVVWAGEAAGVRWPGGDWALAYAAALFLAVGLGMARALRPTSSMPGRPWT